MWGRCVWGGGVCRDGSGDCMWGWVAYVGVACVGLAYVGLVCVGAVCVRMV